MMMLVPAGWEKMWSFPGGVGWRWGKDDDDDDDDDDVDDVA